MRLRLIAESVGDPMTAKIMDNLSRVTSGSLIDNDDSRVSWPFIYSVDLGLYIGDQDNYHKDIFNAQPFRITKTLRNIYQGGDLDSYYQPIANSLKPGVAGRLGLDLTQIVDDAEDDLTERADPAIRAKFRTARVVTFFKDHPKWVALALAELLQRGLIESDNFVVIKGKVSSVNEKANAEEPEPTPAADAPPPSSPAPARSGPSKKTWQGETSKLYAGRKWWAPYSEGKK